MKYWEQPTLAFVQAEHSCVVSVFVYSDEKSLQYFPSNLRVGPSFSAGTSSSLISPTLIAASRMDFAVS